MMKKYINKLGDYLKSENTTFKYLITAISYEGRCLRSVERILENFTIENVIIINFGKKYLDQQLQKKWNQQRDILYRLFEKKRIPFIEKKANPVLFNTFFEEIRSSVEGNCPNIINITTLPKNYILRFAKEFDNEKNIFFYHRPREYRKPTKNELKIGVEKIVPVEGFEGERDITAEDLLVLILGYEGHRALSFLSIFEPYEILPLISIPKEGNKEIDDKFYNNVIKCNQSLLRKHKILKNPSGQFFTISSLNHIMFFKEISKIIKPHKKKGIDISISPIGTKAQSLGLYLYWRENPDMQIIYSVPFKRVDVASPNIDIIDNKEKTLYQEESIIYKLPKEGAI